MYYYNNIYKIYNMYNCNYLYYSHYFMLQLFPKLYDFTMYNIFLVKKMNLSVW